MNIQLISIIPAVASMIWAIIVKIRERKFEDAAFLSLSATCVFINAILVYEMIVSEISVGLHMVQMASCASIIPLIYMFFSMQMGRSLNNVTTAMLWVLAALSFVPEIVIYNPFKPFIYPESGFNPFVVYFISNGEKRFAIYTGDLMVALQALLTMFRIVPFAIKLRRFNLQFNPKVYVFGIWWVITILATVLMSGMSYEDLRSPFGEWFYFLTYSLLVISINVLIALRFDLHPIETNEGEVVRDINVYVQNQFNSLSEKMKSIVEKNQFYLDAECTSEHMVTMLGTNRTYFTKMMASEMGMTFNEYINSLRMIHVEELLSSTISSVSDIAIQSGFSDSGYMSRKFKEKHGISPTEWRKAHKA